MSETIPGDLHVSNDVLADVVGNAGIAKILPASRLRRGIVVSQAEHGVRVDLYIVVEYGINVSTVTRNLSDAVRFALTEYTRIPLAAIEVHVQGIKVK